MASGFTQYFSKWKAPLFCYKKGFMKFKRGPGGHLGYELDTRRLGFHEAYRVKKHFEAGGHSAISHIDKICCMMERPRVIKFTDLDFGILENIEVRIPADQYEQPFSTTIIELPDVYRKQNTVHDPFFDTPPPKDSVNMDRVPKMWPMFVASTWRKELEMLSIHIFLSSSDVYGVILGRDTHTLEEQLAGADDTFIKSLKITDEEKETYSRILRACLNANLFASQTELVMSPENPTYFEKLKRHAEAVGSPNWLLYKQHPFIYTPVKTVVEEAGECVTRTSTGGWTVSPHWRRPHWRMQRCGVGLCEQKKILIKGVFVNAEQLL